MTTVNVTACDGLGCPATTEGFGTDWMSVSIAERTHDLHIYSRHADLCPVHAQALLDACGPLPRKG